MFVWLCVSGLLSSVGETVRMSDFEGTENLLKTLAGKLKSPEAAVAIRPENITILTEEPPVSQEWNLLEGEVQEYTDLGPIVNVAVEVGFVLKARLDKRPSRGFKSGRGNARLCSV